jgi:hypothetical protein
MAGHLLRFFAHSAIASQTGGWVLMASLGSVLFGCGSGSQFRQTYFLLMFILDGLHVSIERVPKTQGLFGGFSAMRHQSIGSCFYQLILHEQLL